MKKIILFLSIVLTFSCNQKSSESEIKTIDSIIVDSPKVKEPSAIELTPMQQYLSDNGFKTDADFNESQFKEFKNCIESGLFKKESFCTVYNKGLKLQGNALKKYLQQYNKIPYFETILFFYGPKVCGVDSEINFSTSTGVYKESDNVCSASEDFIKQDLRNPDTAEFSSLDCSVDNNDDGSYTVLRKISAKNSFGVQSSYVYKVTLGFKGGNWVEKSNWDLINIQSQEFK